MEHTKRRLIPLRVFMASGFAACLFVGSAAGQTPELEARRAGMKDLQDNNRIMDGMEKDKAAKRTKEERIAIVNEAFKRLQVLHNEIMAMMTSAQAIDNAKLLVAAEEIKQRAIELNANLALPGLPKQKADKESSPVAPMVVNEQMSSVCSKIGEFVKDINLSPTDPKMGLQARRDLAAIIAQSDNIIAVLKPSKAKE
jgi:hypothetical protein